MPHFLRSYAAMNYHLWKKWYMKEASPTRKKRDGESVPLSTLLPSKVDQNMPRQENL
jgi:hypothetical protein